MEPSGTITPDDQPQDSTPEVTPAGPAQYEFSENDNAVIGSLASKMLFVGIAVLVASVIVIIAGISRRDAVLGVTSLIYACIGSLTIAAARSFRKVVQSQGSDISYLMTALDDLRWIYMIQYWFILISSLSVGALLLIETTAR
jgi:hypothetical protein